MYQKAQRMLFEKNQPSDADTEPSEIPHAFQLGQEVYFWEKSFGELKWNGPYPIVKILPHKIRLQISPKSTKWFYNDRISPTAGFSQTGDGTPQNASSEASEVANSAPYNSSEVQQLIQSQLDKIQAIQKLMMLNQLIKDSDQPSALINATQRVPPASDAPINETVEYLRDLSYRVYNSPLGDLSAFAPGELDYWNSFAPYDRNILLTGDPLHPPEWRRNLIAFADPEDYLPPPQEALPNNQPPLPNGSSGTTRNSTPTSTPPTAIPKPVDLNNNPTAPKKKTTAARIKSSLGKSFRKSYKGFKKAADPSTWYSALGEPSGPSKA